jgi:cobyrinic acid a,c-diamide synthase
VTLELYENTMTTCPALLVAAPASGQGKTTITAALARLMVRSGKRVRVFKCGPDFLDPYWLALASGHPVYQLDLWMTGETDCRARLAQAAHEADLVIVEGVMGLFDGEPSAADLAQRFDLPVLAVIDASAMAGTFGALAFGLQHYSSELPWAGVLANRVASENHAQMLANAVDQAQWMGAVHRNNEISLPERHLGLTMASEVTDALARLDRAADALAATRLGEIAVDAQARQLAWGVSFEDQVVTPEIVQRLAGVRIAVARDAAFCFIYQANLDTLRALGATVMFFSPLGDTALPECDAVWLPGGYPELHMSAITANQAFQKSLVAHVRASKPVWAECGGMIALFDAIVTLEGQAYAAWGLLEGTVRMQSRLAGLGPQQMRIGEHILRGHTFHYSKCETALTPVDRSSRPNTLPSPQVGEALYSQGSIRASYFHAWFASSPEATAALFKEQR